MLILFWGVVIERHANSTPTFRTLIHLNIISHVAISSGGSHCYSLRCHSPLNGCTPGFQFRHFFGVFFERKLVNRTVYVHSLSHTALTEFKVVTIG
ncbi:Uncharacterised protein [Yersinia pekkanenii]|uniref:Secreted protein n=1 Tax=Yersinia pekkanenii TaxID=1288385 RepID=A0ABP1ZVI6_9GAMM|nr:Uncharacterised protein [Yersinia pekkanenii]